MSNMRGGCRVGVRIQRREPCWDKHNGQYRVHSCCYQATKINMSHMPGIALLAGDT